MELLKITYIDYGMAVDHNMPCSVYTDEPAVLTTIHRCGVFAPSWKAQKAGWRLIKADTKFKLWVVKKVFGSKR